MIKINLINDLRHMINESFKSFNITKNTHNLSDVELLYNYIYFNKRRITAKSRKVIYDKEKIENGEHYEVIKQIIELIELGNDINSYISWRIEDLSYNDKLLNDWGVYHLHLGKDFNIKRPKYIERTNDLLFVRFDDEFAYIIGIFNHTDWYKKEIIEYIINNWPESIEKYKLIGITSDNISDDEIKGLRSKNLGYAIGINGSESYTSWGGGYLSNGKNAESYELAIRIIEKIRNSEYFIKQKESLFHDEIMKRMDMTIETLNFKLIEFGDKVRVLEKNSELVFELK